MYRKSQQNQVQSSTKKLLYTAFFEKTPFFKRDINEYLSSLTETQREITEFFLNYRYANNIRLTNAYVAKQIGCCTKSVTRTTNKLQQDGFLVKKQDNKYSPNNFKLSDTTKKGPQAYLYWLNSLTEDNKSILMTHGVYLNHKKELTCLYEYVPQNNNIYKNKYIYNKPITISRAREDGIDGDGYGFLSKKQKERRENYVKGVAMLKQEQKKWILEHRSDPRVKDLLNNPKIRPLLITPTITTLTKLLTLDDREQLKLIAFEENALKYALMYIQPICEGKKALKSEVKDRMGWLVSIANAFCKKNNISPDWAWYFELCEIVGIEAIKQGEPAKPLVLEKPKPRNAGGHSPATPKPVIPLEEQIAILKKDIAGLTHSAENYTGTMNFMKTFALSLVERKKVELQELESIKESHGSEKQIVLH